MSPEQIVAERAEFEEEYIREFWNFRKYNVRWEGNCYNHLDVNLGWCCWLARAEQAHAEKIALLRRLLDDGPANKSLDLSMHVSLEVQAQLSVPKLREFSRVITEDVSKERQSRSERNLQNAVWRDFITAELAKLKDKTNG